MNINNNNKLVSTTLSSFIGQAYGEKAGRENELSFGQSRIWLQDQLNCGSHHLNLARVLKLSGNLNLVSLKRSFDLLIARHQSLHTCFPSTVQGEAATLRHQSFSLEMPVTDLSPLAEGVREAELAFLLSAEAGRPFDLTRDLMLRVHLLKISAQEHILLVITHAIACDPRSMKILLNELGALYSACEQGKKEALTPITLLYADYVSWQRHCLQTGAFDQQLAYWEQQLKGLPLVHGLPLDYPRPAVQTFIGDVYVSKIDQTSYRLLIDLCRDQGVSLFAGLHAVFSILMSRYSNTDDIVLGTRVDNRQQSGTSGIIGGLMNLLVLRSSLAGAPNFLETLALSGETIQQAYEHQQLPFDCVIKHLQPQSDLSHSPLFQIMMTLEEEDESFLALPGIEVSELNLKNFGGAQFDLNLNIVEKAQGLELSWEFNTALFNQETIQQMAGHFEILLSAVLQSPNTNVFAHELVIGQERQQLLHSWNNTAIDWPSNKCIHEFFEVRASLHPEQEAVRCDGTYLTYGELNHRANQLAYYLKAKGVKPDTLVGVCVERSLDMMVSILAILKAGGAYLPLDPDYPETRLAYMLSDSGIDIVLTQARVLDSLPFLKNLALCIDDEQLAIRLSAMPSDNLPVSSLGLGAEHLAYVIYTSGSTGRPKGVMVEHGNTVALLAWALGMYSQQTLECVLASTSMCFDLSIFEMFAPLAAGGSVLIVKNILDFSEADDIDKVTLVNTVPSAAQVLLTGVKLPAKLKTVNLAGEALKQELVDGLYQAGFSSVYDLYGPSEDTTYSTYKLRTANGRASIGTAIANTQLYVLTPSGQLAPIGVSGELYIGGAGLTRGYLNRPELNDEKFVANPFYGGPGSNSSKRLYRTGDLVRWLPCGELEYLGRIDHQVKVRGFRIELGEIEHVLEDCEGIKDAVVLARESDNNDKRLVAYLVATGSDSHEARLMEEVRQQARKTLPEYMVPAAFVLLEHLPLTANGKLDRSALPEPDMKVLRAEYVAPKTETEKILSGIWQEVLEIERVGVLDDFFHLGGHSLLVMKMLAKIEKRLHVKLSVTYTFTMGNLSALALHIDVLTGRHNPDNNSEELDFFEI
ncbi:amino acid adenylation domain-containing protein [Pseudoalteromonas luteoviolacea]|uniref:non-ribosomal peptide synthetase n=1 Tax=Pseudoalteromonas luteoviolacea TaxID=43657 RepID=UPI001B3A6911|nr:non-ribosomal peptide synthetase [Pseudoalteromonas luteoviolacea]MBQ4880458.1 amino acid adenylation domain-containing protein [Pseudoalteromonas luteoviolacea]MBQ4909514.1 amino acid adenylation domain-containing protein [Pseudoalteromonas luteoviolacea]